MGGGAEIACPHCTLLNPASRKRCAVCLKALHKRDRPAPSDSCSASLSASGTAESSPMSSLPARSSDTSERAVHKVARKEVPSVLSASGATDKMATLFSTAAGKPVLVSKAALQKAKVSMEGVWETDSDNGEGGTAPTASSRVVSALFATASGKPVDISEELLQEAEGNYGNGGKLDPKEKTPLTTKAPTAASDRVSTIFSTAAGKPVSVSKAALEEAERKLSQNEGEDPSPHKSSPEPATERKAGTTVPAKRQFQPPKQQLHTSPTTASQHDLVNVPASGNGGAPLGRRRGFVPPQRKSPPTNTQPTLSGRSGVTHDRTAHTLYPPPSATAQAGRDLVLVTRGPAVSTVSSRSNRSSVKAVPLAISPSLSEAPVVPQHRVTGGNVPTRTALPSAADVGKGAFQFTFADCNEDMASQLLGSSSAGAPPHSHPSPTALVEDTHWHHFLLGHGASPALCTLYWCQQMIKSALMQLRELALDALGETEASVMFTPFSLALLLCLRYNREFVEGERPALRKLVEGDIPPASLMVLAVSEVCEERAAPHIRVVRLTDGFYHVKASLDVPLSSLVREGVLAAGRRVAVCGAKLLLHGQCSPEECGAQQTVMSLNYNCVRPVAPFTPLGLGVSEPAPLPIRLVHPLGGLVPALEGIVVRVLPAFYVNQPIPQGANEGGGRTGTAHVSKLVRNRHAQMVHYSKLARRLAARHDEESLLHAQGSPDERGSGRPSAPLTGLPQRVSRVQSLLLRSLAPSPSGVTDGKETPAYALIQHWETCDDEALCARGAMADDGGNDAGLPAEGTHIVVYALNPAKSQTAAAPFAHAKLFYSSRTLHFAPLKAATASRGDVAISTARHTYQTLTGTTELALGAAVDVVGLCLGSTSTPQGHLTLLLMGNDNYALVQVPLPSPTREVTLDTPATTNTTQSCLLLVQNATFISHEDSQAGSDCARVFANEYTVTTTRAKHIPGGEATLAEDLRVALLERFKSAERRHIARRDEIFRCCTEEAPPSFPQGGSDGGAFSVARVTASSLLDDEGQRYALHANASSTPSSTRTGDSHAQDGNGAAERRLPYYLRNQGGSVNGAPPTNGAKRTGVVFLSNEAATATQKGTAGPTTVVSRDPNVRPVYHYYGNVVRLELLLSDTDTPRTLFVEKANPTEAFHQPSRGPPSDGRRLTAVRVVWRYGGPDETCSGLISSGAVLDDLLDAALTAQKLCFLCASDGDSGTTRAQSSVLAAAKHQGIGAWWSLLLSSLGAVTVDSAGDAPGVTPPAFAWSSEEWTTALELLHDKLKHVLFKFTLSKENCQLVEKVFALKEGCPIEKLVS